MDLFARKARRSVSLFRFIRPVRSAEPSPCPRRRVSPCSFHPRGFRFCTVRDGRPQCLPSWASGPARAQFQPNEPVSFDYANTANWDWEPVINGQFHGPGAPPGLIAHLRRGFTHRGRRRKSGLLFQTTAAGGHGPTFGKSFRHGRTPGRWTLNGKHPDGETSTTAKTLVTIGECDETH